MLKKNILFKISGSIAAYKSACLISSLVQEGHEVQIVSTLSVNKFIGDATLEGLTGKPVLSDLYEYARFEFCNSHFEKTNLIAKRDSCGGCRIVGEQSSLYFKWLILNNPNCRVNIFENIVNDDEGYKSSILR